MVCFTQSTVNVGKGRNSDMQTAKQSMLEGITIFLKVGYNREVIQITVSNKLEAQKGHPT